MFSAFDELKSTGVNFLVHPVLAVDAGSLGFFLVRVDGGHEGFPGDVKVAESFTELAIISFQ